VRRCWVLTCLLIWVELRTLFTCQQTCFHASEGNVVAALSFWSGHSCSSSFYDSACVSLSWEINYWTVSAVHQPLWPSGSVNSFLDSTVCTGCAMHRSQLPQSVLAETIYFFPQTRVQFVLPALLPLQEPSFTTPRLLVILIFVAKLQLSPPPPPVDSICESETNSFG
jgi:hypothetical protein